MLAGCGGPEEVPAQKVAAGQPAPAKVASQPQPAAGSKLLIKIIPEPPTADGCIKALVSGSRQASYLWRVDGQEVADQTTNMLCGEFFKRGAEVMVTVSDGKTSGSESVTIANAPPRFTEVSVNADGIQKHAALVVKPTVIDVDGDSIDLRYQWYVNGEADPLLTEDTLPASRYARGDTIRFTIVATDGMAESKPYQSETAAIPNAPPQIVSQPPQQFEATEYSYQVKARDPDGDKLAYTLTKMPAGMTINRATGLIAWPLTGVKAGVYPLRIVVRDPDGAEAFQEYALTLGVPASAPAAAKKP
jgi:hypothetical protein